MADNVAYKTDASATEATLATKEVTFSGDTTDVQLCELVAVGGTEGSRTITEISSETDGVLVNLGGNNDVTVTSGTVTANAGTNLNTSALLTTTNFTDVFGTTSVVTTANLADAVAATQDVLNVRNFNYVFNGSTFDLVREGSTAGSILVDGSGVTQPVSGTITANAGSGTFTTELPTAVSVTTDNTAAPTAPQVYGHMLGFDGTDWARVRTDAGGNLQIDVLSGTVDTVTTVTTVTTVSTVTNLAQLGGNAISMNTGARDAGTQRVTVANDDIVQTVGNVAHDAADSGNPLLLGTRAVAHGTNPTAVAANDRARMLANRHGIPWVIGGHPNVVTRSARNTAAQTDTALVTVAGGLKIVVTRVEVTNANDSTVDVDFEVGFGASTVPAAAAGAGVAGMIADFQGCPPGGGMQSGTGAGILGIGADGEDLRYSNTVPTTGSCTVTVSYYTVES